jgi:diacylglycerol kinase family enzyme
MVASATPTPPVSPAAALERLAEVAALERPAEAKRMLVIVNPYATTMSDRLKHLVVYALQGRYDVHAVDTQRRGHATELCREAAREGYDVVVAFGGDGTVNEAANGLIGTETALTCLPGGSNNVYCKMLGIPADVVDATEHLLLMADAWYPRPADLGIANGRRFTFAAGMGLDASVVERVDRHPHLKTRFGAWYFTEAAVLTFLRRYVVSPPQLEVRAGERTVRGVSAFFQNAAPYTYFKSRPVNLVDGAQLDSGDLAGVVLTRANPIDLPTVAFRALSGAARIARHRRVEALSGLTEATVRSLDGRPVPFQVDGDHIGDAEEVTFSVDPNAIRVVS